jgi:hypothetical protein
MRQSSIASTKLKMNIRPVGGMPKDAVQQRSTEARERAIVTAHGRPSRVCRPIVPLQSSQAASLFPFGRCKIIITDRERNSNFELPSVSDSHSLRARIRRGKAK